MDTTRETIGTIAVFFSIGQAIRSAHGFGNEEADRRRERDLRHDNEASRQSDSHYSSWRGERTTELDRDYDEYCRENAQRFHDEFTSWRSERQGWRECLAASPSIWK